MLKIISGKLKGREIYSKKGLDTRPTTGKSRSAIFNVLESRYDIQQYKIIDLFAGTGALGFEALSRGAASAAFVELDKKATQLIEKNAEHLKITKDCEIFRQEAIRWLKKKHWEPIPKILLMDPPYQTNLAQECIDELAKVRKTISGSLIVLETHKKNQTTYPESFVLFQQKHYGSTCIDFLEIQ